MMNSDPRFANNPMLQQSLIALQSNPEMIQQVSRMMSDPNNGIDRMMAGMNATNGASSSTGVDPFAGGPESLQRLMEQFQRNSQQFGGSSGGTGFGTGGGSGGGGRMTSTSSALGSVNSNNTDTVGERVSNDDSAMTEEEMIAEAIARSLREP